MSNLWYNMQRTIYNNPQSTDFILTKIKRLQTYDKHVQCSSYTNRVFKGKYTRKKTNQNEWLITFATYKLILI